MTDVTRRGLLAGTALLGATGALAPGALAPAGIAAAQPNARPSHRPLSGGVVKPNDPRYADLLLRGQNRRFSAKPESIRLVGSTEQVVRAVQEAVRGGKRISVRSGGHCFEGFVDNPDVELILDMSMLAGVRFDERRRAFEIEPGATLGEVYQALYYGWGVTIPGGGCLSVGAGGHFSGGGYGPLSRLLGSVVDYIHAVEVVVVDGSGRARAVVATREPSDPHHDLWWAHTGGGGGSFGIVTRYWLRTPGATGSDPSGLLPKPPGTLLTNGILWSWEGLDKADLTTILRNFSTFYEQHSAPDSPYASLYTPMLLSHKSSQPGFLLSNQIDGTLPDAERLLKNFTDAVTKGVESKSYVMPPTRLPFMNGTLARSIAESYAGVRAKWKAGYLRKGYSTAQLETIYDYLTGDKHGKQDATFLMLPYGGKVNTIAPDATATAQRDSILKVVFVVNWQEAGEDEAHLRWAREFYRDVYAETGGVPVSGAVSDGSYINYPDVDLADPAWNTSGVPWHTLYYKDNYPRLQQVKAKYDPRDVFRHALSVRLPS